ncbi:hypothetical protein HRG_006906 [Hirsutella rhossiliensis]|uniref:F-box domain-containing protein n=1 Tax=Hirsutella rhossiliensis TaxID=111463 RepID=A0A9P8MX23_9HYPO|nr:uncharacterized protein HRG_06906 [Hirsutella rhossiliensis]KAH0961826.1 hypothetical protein HRG_06906 [Hirsutella rhossiliensis]
MVLSRLPSELLLAIMQALDHPRDLAALVKASPLCCRLYFAAPSLVVSCILRNAIQPDALHDALAVLHAPWTPDPGALSWARPSREPLRACLEQYFDKAKPFAFPSEWKDLMALDRLLFRATYFVNDYSSEARMVLFSDGGADPSAPLSPTELARFQRAFFRYELYSRLFPPDCREANYSLEPAQEQFDRFLARIEPWEAEEMSCVHCYYTSLIGKLVDDMEDGAVGNVHSYDARSLVD